MCATDWLVTSRVAAVRPCGFSPGLTAPATDSMLRHHRLPASDCRSLRIYDTPLEAFQLVNPEAAAGAAGTAAGDSAAGEPVPAGQRVPVQPPAAGSPQQVGSGEDSLAPALRIQEGELIYDWCW